MVHLLWCLVNFLVQFCNAMFNCCGCILLLYTMWGINRIWLHLIHEKHIQVLYFLVFNHLVWINGFSMWLELIWWICNVLIYHHHILLIACEPLLNLMTNYLICVAGKQWEALRFTIEVRMCMVCCLIAHYCAIAGTILIFRFF